VGCEFGFFGRVNLSIENIYLFVFILLVLVDHFNSILFSS
jgi:hypothetical protein